MREGSIFHRISLIYSDYQGVESVRAFSARQIRGNIFHRRCPKIFYFPIYKIRLLTFYHCIEQQSDAVKDGKNPFIKSPYSGLYNRICLQLSETVSQTSRQKIISAFWSNLTNLLLHLHNHHKPVDYERCHLFPRTTGTQ